MGSNSFRKYIIYAIGEIILVMVGILLALQVNNWNESRKEKKSELQILQQFKKDLETNLLDLELNEQFQRKCVKSSEILLSHMSSDKPFHDSLEIHFANVFVWSKFVVNTGAYQTLQSKGVELISDLELRNAILSIYEKQLTWNQTYEQVMIDKVEHFRNIDGADFFSELKVIEGKSKVLDYSSLRNDNRFIYYLNSQVADFTFFIGITEGYIESHHATIELIDDVLNHQ